MNYYLVTDNIIFSAPASPPANVMATVMSSTSILVTWDMVLLIDQNGNITMYQVLYEPQQTFGGAIGEETATVSALNSSVTLTRLQEYVTYNISIRAVTNGGVGVYSEEIVRRTFEDGT